MSCTVCDIINEMEKAFIGLIFLWYGAIGDIPEGWQLCDGTNGTPDLRNRFLICSQSHVVLPPGRTGGHKEHQHFFTGDGHLHELYTGFIGKSGFVFKLITSAGFIAGITDPGNHIPPYKALCYIMRKES